MSTIFVAGFVKAGEGGFEWRRSRSELEAFRQSWIESGDADVSDVVELNVDQLALAPGDFTDEAVTDALDSWPEVWEPTYGQNRGGRMSRTLARAVSWVKARLRAT